jgi:hypothetical protein
MSTPLRLRRASPPPTTRPSARSPSHFGSNAHARWSAGSSRAAVGCIGRNPAGGVAGLAAAYWHDLYPLMPDDYRSPECRSGGPLDEQLADAPWLAPMRS